MVCIGCRFDTKTLDAGTLDFGEFPNEYKILVSSYISRNIDDVVNIYVSNEPPNKGIAKTQSFLEKIRGKDAYYGWSGLVRVITNKKEYIVVGRRWVNSKYGGYWSNTYSDKPVVTGRIDTMYKYYIRDNEVVGLEPLK